jgi:hypothetical protein
MVRGRRLGGDAGVEDARADLSRDAGTVVGDPHLDSVLLRVSHQHLDAAAVPGGVDSVVHQVVDDRDQVVASAVTDFGVRVQPNATPRSRAVADLVTSAAATAASSISRSDAP